MDYGDPPEFLFVIVKSYFFYALTCLETGLNNTCMNEPRPLTNDQRKASEAAFQGRPFDPAWSQSARIVYEGLINALGGKTIVPDFDQDPPWGLEPNPLSFDSSDELEPGSMATSQDPNSTPQNLHVSHSSTSRIASRDEAIRAGLVIDVSEIAKELGMDLAVGITKSLWDKNVIASTWVSSEEWHSRVRDMLLAVRLRMANVENLSPWFEVPVLLPQQRDERPKVFPIYALFHKDPITTECLTLIHPREISSLKLSPQSPEEDSAPEED